MVVVIHQTTDTRNALLYNEQKVKEGVATYFHISFNPSGADCLKMDEKAIRQEISKMMEQMGYGSQQRLQSGTGR
jgi:hypothetical protein